MVGSLVDYRDGTRAIVVEIDPDREADIVRVVDLFGAEPSTDRATNGGGHHWNDGERKRPRSRRN